MKPATAAEARREELDGPDDASEEIELSAFMLVEIAVKDEALYAKYMERIPRVIQLYQGRYVIRSSAVIPNVGGWAPDRIVLIEFPTLADLRKCFGSREYSELAPIRERSTVSRSVVIET